jgi:hypothetical protein
MKLLLLLIVTTTLGGCVRPGDHPVSLNCIWDEEDSRSLDLTKTSDQSHLRFDAVTAEDVAIRWGDKYIGHRPEYDQRVGQCRETLFDGVAKHHSVDVAIVRQYSVDRDLLLDTVVIIRRQHGKKSQTGV